MESEIKDVRPKLNRDISVEDFLEFYWLKEELQDFSREVGLSASGSKNDVAERIASFLKTGEKTKIVKKPSSVTRSSKQSYLPLSEMTLETIIEPGFKCTQQHREFFKGVIGSKFHFSVDLQNFFKENAGKTYQDAVNHYYKIQENKKRGIRTTISKQFEYNTFIRDYYDDSRNKGNPLNEAISAWNDVRSQRGDNVYRPKQK